MRHETNDMSRRVALAEALGIDAQDIGEGYDDCVFTTVGREEYLVLTDEEADIGCQELIEESLWAFNPTFLQGYLPDGVDAVNDLQDFMHDRCEGANPLIRALVGDRFDSLVVDAIGCDGRGHFLSQYDGEEIELEGGYFAYQL